MECVASQALSDPTTTWSDFLPGKALPDISPGPHELVQAETGRQQHHEDIRNEGNCGVVAEGNRSAVAEGNHGTVNEGNRDVIAEGTHGEDECSVGLLLEKPADDNQSANQQTEPGRFISTIHGPGSRLE